MLSGIEGPNRELTANVFGQEGESLIYQNLKSLAIESKQKLNKISIIPQ